MLIWSRLLSGRIDGRLFADVGVSDTRFVSWLRDRGLGMASRRKSVPKNVPDSADGRPPPVRSGLRAGPRRSHMTSIDGDDVRGRQVRAGVLSQPEQLDQAIFERMPAGISSGVSRNTSRIPAPFRMERRGLTPSRRD